MAGGEGTRLRPLTANQPKPMLPMANRPMAEHVVSLLRKHGFTEIVVTVSFLANQIRTYFGDGSEFGVSMVYATEETPLGTAGSVLNAREQLDERFLVISGDVLTDIDLSELVAFHDKQDSVATLALKAMDNPLEFGIVITGQHGRVERFLEKPGWGDVFSDTINTGIYVLEPEVFDWIEEGRPVDFSGEVFPAMLEEGRPLHGFVAGGYWEDVGTLEAYLRAHTDILDGKVELVISGFPLRPGVWVGEGAEIHPSASVQAPAAIGANCRIGPVASIGPHTVLGTNVRVGENTVIERSVLHDNCYLATGVTARGSVMARSCDIRQGVHVEEGVVLGDGCRVGRGAVLRSGVKVYPNKTIEAGAVVSSSIVWESRGSRSLFGRLGVSGIANVDLSPELAMRVAMAYGSILPKGATVTTSRDSSRAARVLKRAVMVGLTAAGCNVEDLEAATVPVTRFQVRTGVSSGGVTVRLVADDPQSVSLRFLDGDGVDLDEATQRKIERLHAREEYRRVLAAEIGDIEFPSRTIELYTAELVNGADVEAIRRARFKLVLDYAFGTTSFVMPNVLAKLGVDVLVMNPHVSTPGVLSFDRETHAGRLGELVRSSGAHLGAMFDPDGEQLTLVDDTGRVLTDDEALGTLVSLFVSDGGPGCSVPGAIVLPVDGPRQAARVAEEAGRQVVWTKLAASELMDACGQGEVAFGGNTQGGFIVPRFLPAFDAVATFVHLLSLLAHCGSRFSETVSSIASPFVSRRDVPTPFEQKGLVMRLLLERARSSEVQLIDGVKLVDADGWTLVVPDPEAPITVVKAESTSLEGAEARVAEMAEQIGWILAEASPAGV
ncbi:MAG: sugar phosphate nucleotidyltransferase [Actinomycetota bacterium]|nr:sugar phosphate nucleotidyltransferase [Actinomycetota bacterium]